MLVQTLRPGDVVVLDNLAVHKQPEVHIAIHAHQAVVRFLPPYSPDFNPIELAFAKLKAFLRAARPRTFDTSVRLADELRSSPPPNSKLSPTAAIASLQDYEKRSRFSLRDSEPFAASESEPRRFPRTGGRSFSRSEEARRQDSNLRPPA